MNRIFIFLSIFILISACQSAKDVLTLKKKESGDEFLIEKKSPLVLPPDYGALPLPGEPIKKTSKKESDIIEETLGSGKISINKSIIKNSEQTPLEKSVLEKIKN